MRYGFLARSKHHLDSLHIWADTVKYTVSCLGRCLSSSSSTGPARLQELARPQHVSQIVHIKPPPANPLNSSRYPSHCATACLLAFHARLPLARSLSTLAHIRFSRSCTELQVVRSFRGCAGEGRARRERIFSRWAEFRRVSG